MLMLVKKDGVKEPYGGVKGFEGEGVFKSILHLT